MSERVPGGKGLKVAGLAAIWNQRKRKQRKGRGGGCRSGCAIAESILQTARETARCAPKPCPLIDGVRSLTGSVRETSLSGESAPPGPR